MTDDASTAYICIYCPFNSDNLQALENHLASKILIDFIRTCLSFSRSLYSGAHEHGCQDALPTQSASSLTPNIITKANKREAPDDEKVIFKHWPRSSFFSSFDLIQSRSSLDDTEETTGIKPFKI